MLVPVLNAILSMLFLFFIFMHIASGIWAEDVEQLLYHLEPETRKITKSPE